MNDVVSYVNGLDLGALEEGDLHTEQAPVLATPAAALAAIGGAKVVGAFVGGATLVGGAYALGRAIG
jgi:predicted GNAT superfamily acetyltransferase